MNGRNNMGTKLTSTNIINKPGRVMRNAFVLTILMIAGAFITGYSSLDGMNGGFALIFLFGFGAMVSLVTALVYIPRAREFDNLINQLNPLANWTYTQKEWDAFIAENQKEMISDNKSTLLMLIVISAIVCGILLLIYQDSLFILIIGGLILLLSTVAFLAPRIRSRRLRKGVHEAYIGKDSAFVGGTFQTWTQLGAHLIDVEIYSESAVPILNIIFEFPTLQSTQQEIVRIPIPVNKIEEAKMVAKILSEQIKNV
jgi:uncharacterized membrane protein YfcA